MNSTKKLYQDIREGLKQSYQAFKTAGFFDDDEGGLRNPEQAEKVLAALEDIYDRFYETKKVFLEVEGLFQKEFAPIADLENREIIIETVFLEPYLFSESEMMPIVGDAGFQEELLKENLKAFQDWCEVKKNFHFETQQWIKENFDWKKKPSELSCPCTQCIADYRTKLRDAVYKEQTERIDRIEDRMHEKILTARIDVIANDVYDLKKGIDKSLHLIRYRMRRSSLNKLDSEIKSYFKEKFSPQSELAKVYKEKLRIFLNSILVDLEMKPDLISENEFERFYSQLGVNIWKPSKFLKREFHKMARAVLSFKRKDVSATILKDYLGQFWMHSEARKLNRKIIYHMGPTNSGKTYHAIQALCEARKGCYLAPLRLLASELYDTMNEKGVVTTLLTGEEVIEKEGATHYSSTIEMAKLHEVFDTVVIDEIQMITDPQRGWAWTRALVNIVADEVHLCGDHSAYELVSKVLKLTGDHLEVKNYNRMTELKVENSPIQMRDLQKSDALIVFSRRNALKFKALLEEHDFKVSIVYGRLSPEVRREQARKFDEGETDIMVSTDAIAMGMNLPVRRIVFSAISKFFNNKEYPLTDSELKQISGRAGRFKRFPTGHVTCLEKVDDGINRLKKALNTDLKQSERSMVGPDLEIFNSVNKALEQHSLPILSLSEFLRLFNTMSFDKPFYCVDLKEMIEVAEMVEQADHQNNLSMEESFGFACAPVNLGLIEHVQYFIWILNHYVRGQSIINEQIDSSSKSIDYLEAAIKCVELYQWLARHFDNKNFSFDERLLLKNKSEAIERLNELLSEKTEVADYSSPRRRGGTRKKSFHRGEERKGSSYQNGKNNNNQSKRKRPKFKRKRKAQAHKNKSESFKKFR